MLQQWTPSGYLIIQFCRGIIYLEVMVNDARWGLCPQDCPPQDANCNHQIGFFCSFILFLQCWGSNPGPCACQASTLPLINPLRSPGSFNCASNQPYVILGFHNSFLVLFLRLIFLFFIIYVCISVSGWACVCWGLRRPKEGIRFLGDRINKNKCELPFASTGLGTSILLIEQQVLLKAKTSHPGGHGTHL